MQKHNKLVRDGIPAIIQSHGEIPVTHIASAEEYWEELTKKLHEEVEEFASATNDEERTEELADILEVIDALCAVRGIALHDVVSIQEAKRKKRGGFAKRIILDDVKR